MDFKVLIESIKSGNPELALASLNFWDKFIMFKNVKSNNYFKKELFI